MTKPITDERLKEIRLTWEGNFGGYDVEQLLDEVTRCHKQIRELEEAAKLHRDEIQYLSNDRGRRRRTNAGA